MSTAPTIIDASQVRCGDLELSDCALRALAALLVDEAVRKTEEAEEAAA